jgi:glycosidase
MRHPLLYQINTRVVLQEIGARQGRPATLDDFADAVLDDIAAAGIQYVWFLGVWQTGEAARAVSRSAGPQRDSFLHTLADLREEDITGSPFAVQDYAVHRDFGGGSALARLRERLARRGLNLLLDFVPNHVAPDHAWVSRHPEFFISGSEEDLAREPQNYARFQTENGPRILAYGRDPYFAGWSDTVQLNYRHPACRRAMRDELLRVAESCDGVRCDMAMLVQPAVFLRTWGDKALPWDGVAADDTPFWPEAIAAARKLRRDFLFLAEVYWDMEWELQQAGFDFTYDKRLYDRLRSGPPRAARDHLRADSDFQERSARFLENHDEPRAAAIFSPEQHRAAALITFLAPGLRFFHEGQMEGRKVRVSMHLGRRPVEAPDAALRDFYRRLLAVLRRPELHEGMWRLWDARPAWDGNWTWDQFIVFSWEAGERRVLVAVNYGPFQGQCYVTLGLQGLAGRGFELIDLLGGERHLRDGDGLSKSGLYLDMPPWGAQVFEMKPQAVEA